MNSSQQFFYLKLLCLLSGSILQLLFSSCGKAPNTLQRPNILLIVADDLGFSDLGCYGGEIRTPNLDKLAYEGIRSTSYYMLPTCSPSRAVLLTGVDNHRAGYGTMEGDWAQNQKGLRGYEGHLNWDVVPVSQLLADAGYFTSISGKWHQAYPASEKSLWPDQRGFERSFCLLQGGAGHFDDMQPLFSRYAKAMYAEDGELLDSLPSGFYSSDFYADKAIQYIDEGIAQNRPFFSYLCFTAPHWPLQIPDSDINLYKGVYDEGYEVLAAKRLERMKELGIISDSTRLPALSPNVNPWEFLTSDQKLQSARTMEIYAAMVERMDANIGRLMRHLKSIGQYENTLIFFMADNGAEGNSLNGILDTREWVKNNFDNSLENMGRKNSYIWTGPAWAQLSSLPYKWYKSFSTEGGVRCPMILRYPGNNKNAASINHKIITLKDITPTILGYAGIPHPGTNYKGKQIYPLDGISMLPWLDGKADQVHRDDEVFCWELYGRRAVRKRNWKANYYEAPYGKQNWELYNLDSDPGEMKDISKEYPEILKELIAAWEEYAKKYMVVLPNEHVAYGVDEIWNEMVIY